jgi:DNA-binding SARP family transcriptional activator
MATLAARGNTAEALRVYADLVRLRRNELGVPPSRPARGLHSRLLRPDGG